MIWKDLNKLSGKSKKLNIMKLMLVQKKTKIKKNIQTFLANKQKETSDFYLYVSSDANSF